MVKVRKKMYTYMHHVQFCEDSEFKMASFTLKTKVGKEIHFSQVRFSQVYSR